MEKDSVLGKHNGVFSISKKDKIIRDIAWEWMEKKSIMLKKETRLKRHEQSLDIEYSILFFLFPNIYMVFPNIYNGLQEDHWSVDQRE